MFDNSFISEDFAYVLLGSLLLGYMKYLVGPTLIMHDPDSQDRMSRSVHEIHFLDPISFLVLLIP